MNWNFDINAANAQKVLQDLGKHYSDLYDQMVGKMGDSIKKWNVWQKIVDYMINLTKQLVDESRELIAISTKYDIPIKKMGEFQMVAQATGQSLGQVARNLRFLEMNVSRALLKPGGPQYQAFMELGVAQDDLNRAAGDTTYMLDIVREKVMAIGDEERRNNFLQAIFGANWQNMLPMIEASKQAQTEAADAGYEYSTSMTESLATVGKNFAEIAQDLKPLVMPFAQIFAFLVTVLAIIVQSVMLIAKILKDGVFNVIKLVIGGLQGTVGALLNGVSRVMQMIPFVSRGAKAVKDFSAELNEAGKKNVTGVITEYEGGNWHKKYQGDKNNMKTLASRGVSNVIGIGESLGLAEEGYAVKELTARIEEQREKFKLLNNQTDGYKKRLKEINQMVFAGVATPEELREKENIEKRIFEIEQRKLAVAKELEELKATYGGRTGKDYKSPSEAGDGSKPRTAEEIKTELDRKKNERETTWKNVMAQTTKVAEMETAMAVVKAYYDQQKILEEIADLKAANGYSQQIETEYIKKKAEAEAELMEKQKEHADFQLKQATALRESERGRRESAIEFTRKREQLLMQRQGYTAMDKQSVSVSESIDKMVRDQERLALIEGDRQKGQADREAARKEVEASAMKAQEELDKYSLMAFQYGASDAAKKGMGGGIDIRENQLTVAKSQLDILKKQLDLMYQQLDINPADYGNAPMLLRGVSRMK